MKKVNKKKSDEEILNDKQELKLLRQQAKEKVYKRFEVEDELDDLLKDHLQKGNDAGELFSYRDTETKTELDDNEIKALSVLSVYENILGVSETFLDDVTSKFMRLRISKKRKSREEYIKAKQTDERLFQHLGGMGQGGMR